jgi:hypothetical protein
MWPRKVLGTSSFVLAAAALVAVIRRSSLRWGATPHERVRALPGDGLMLRAHLQSTRAVTVDAGADDVWPWIAQLGQGRGGFYSYDRLENLLGCDMHSSDVVLPQWQNAVVGDEVRLAPEMPLTVAVADAGHALVLTGGILIGAVPSPWTFSWAFVLLDAGNGSTRLVVRERYGYTAWWAALVVEPTELVSLVMSLKMLRGIKERAERALRSAPERGPSVASVGAAG